MMDNSLSQLRQLVTHIAPLNSEEWEAFSVLWKPFFANRKQIITEADHMEKYLYFVVSGVQRVFYRDNEGREATLVFTYAPSFGGVLDAMLLNQKSAYYYETISKSVFLRAPFTEIRQLMYQYESINDVVMKGLSFALKGVLERMVELQTYSSEQKFRQLLSRSPHILQHVPHKYLANYLGIDPSNFSKLMNKVVF
jgi:CRP-like cAMP-binding protein